MDNQFTIWTILKLVGSLALLMYGMKSMSESLQKMAGPQLRHVLQSMTKNRFFGTIAGMLVTASVQSSTATTVMTVSFVNAGLLTLAQAIAIIMGANIGTTITAWIMSAGFYFDIDEFVWLTFIIGIILIYSKKRKFIGDFLFGIALLFLGLGTLKATGFAIDFEQYPALVSFLHGFGDNYLSYIIFLLIGAVLTSCVQSSAAIMAITMTLSVMGMLPVYLGIALVMGENIGTTIASNIAALKANIQARRAAFAHCFFNCFGVVLMLFVFKPFVNLVCAMWGYPTGADATDKALAENVILLPLILATFHTAFNVIGTLILIWFIPVIERIACTVISGHKDARYKDEEEDGKLHFITAGILATPELSVLEARKEIQLFGERIQRMFGMVIDLIHEQNDNKFVKIFTRIEKYEGISDSMEIEIAKYLDEVSDNHLSDETKASIRAMLREISEIESIGDSCYNLARTLNRLHGSRDGFNEKQMGHIHQMFNLANDALTEMNVMLNGKKAALNVNHSFNIELEINNYRNQLKNQNINDVNNHVYTYAIGTMYMDIINECEKLGDYIVNVVEARMGTRQKRE